jgi:hypothetical protein
MASYSGESCGVARPLDGLRARPYAASLLDGGAAMSDADHLLHYPEVPTRPVRLLRVYLSNLDHEANGLPVQLPLPLNRPRPSGVDDIFAGT